MKNQILVKRKSLLRLSLSMFCFSMIAVFAVTSLHASVTSKEVMSREEKTLDLLTNIDAFTEENESLKLDAAKAHYNMGNIYFYKGEYEIAAREYYQAVTLMPDDPDTHYNLAFVSGEHLRDFQTALKHYQMYLYLNPKAKDKHFVRGKIMEAKLAIRSVVDSPLEDNLQ